MSYYELPIPPGWVYMESAEVLNVRGDIYLVDESQNVRCAVVLANTDRFFLWNIFFTSPSPLLPEIADREAQIFFDTLSCLGYEKEEHGNLSKLIHNVVHYTETAGIDDDAVEDRIG